MFDWISNAFYRWKMFRKGLINPNARKVNRKHSRVSDFFAKKTTACTIIVLLLTFSGTFAILFAERIPEVPYLIVNQISSVAVYSQFEFNYEDKIAAQREEQTARQSVPLYYRVQDHILPDLQETLQGLNQALLLKYPEQPKNGKKQLSENKAESFVHSLTKQQREFLKQVVKTPDMFQTLSGMLEDSVFAGILSDEEKQNHPQTFQVRIIYPQNRRQDPRLLREIPSARQVSQEIAGNVLQQHPLQKKTVENPVAELSEILWVLLNRMVITYDKAFTLAEQDKAAAKVVPPRVFITKGQELIRKDVHLTERDLQCLKAYQKELAARRQSGEKKLAKIQHIACSFCINLILNLFMVFCFARILPEEKRTTRYIYLTGLLAAVAIAFNMGCRELFFILEGYLTIPPNLLYLALPLGFASIVAVSISGTHIAMITGLYMSLVTAVILHGSLQLALTGLFISGTAAYAVKSCCNYRSHFLRGFLVCSVIALLFGSFLAFEQGILFSLDWRLVFLPFVTGLLTVSLAQIVIGFAEYILECSTKMSMLLYSDYNHPLLKRLQMEAPGTYHHSIIVSMLAEVAAKEIGADPIKARVCSLFHDVGKLAHPEYFTENAAGENKHAELTPKFSAMIIISHVKEGLELARKYKLKKPIRDAIQQHHGTDIVYYFYMQAKKTGEIFDENDFRYPGPRPATKEAAIISLADACEAASRSLDKVNHGKIDELVSDIFLKRLRSGQLNDSNLTFCELQKIHDSFVKTLIPMLHTRIAYPKEKKEDEDDLFMETKTASPQTNEGR